jgi:FKBP-type peptidyl-prolyl cis-trans isomerase FklB
MKSTLFILPAASVLMAACTAAAPANDTEALEAARACTTPDETEILLAEGGPTTGDAATNAAASQTYLAEVRDERCVFELESGLMVRVRVARDADAASPVSGDQVTVHYRGQFPNGEEFDSSYSRGEPATFPSDRLIDGWVEALPLMRVGEIWELYIPSELAYGARGIGPIGPNQALVFQLELVGLPDAAE